MATPKCHFEALENRRQLLVVGMNEVKILLPGGVAGIGTANLNGCTAVAVLGKAIILAHISPVPATDLQAPDPNRRLEADEGDNHFKALLDSVQQLYNANKQFFPSKTTAWAIFGVFEAPNAATSGVERHWMSEKYEIAKKRFNKMKIVPEAAFYGMKPASQRTSPAAGTVIGLLQGGRITLYVEDEIKHEAGFESSARQGQASIGNSTQQPESVVAVASSSNAVASSSKTAEDQKVLQSQAMRNACLGTLSRVCSREDAIKSMRHYVDWERANGQHRDERSLLMAATGRALSLHGVDAARRDAFLERFGQTFPAQ